MNRHREGIRFVVVCCFILILAMAIAGNTTPAYSQGPYGPGFGPGMGGPGMGGSGMGGPGMGGPGMGGQRACCSHPGAGGMNLQRGITQEPAYCRMLLDRTDLNLTPKQREDIRMLQTSYMKETFDLRSDLQINKIELRKLRFAEKPDFNAIKAKLEKIAKMQLDLQTRRAKLQLEADKILTKEQRDALYLLPCMGLDIDWDVADEGPDRGTGK